MRSTITVMLSLFTMASLVSGCSYSWSGPELRRLGEVPHWPDCDEDGWGDRDHVDAETNDRWSCREIGAARETFNGVECPVVENNYDCDDSFAMSGADYTGLGCVANAGAAFGTTEISSDSYAVTNDNQREFMVVDIPVSRSVANHVCDAWAVGTPETIDDILPFGGVATLDTSEDRQSAERAASMFDEPTLWVSVRFLDDGTLAWDSEVGPEGEEATIPVDLAYCDGGPPLTPFEAFNLAEGLPDDNNTAAQEQQALDGLLQLHDTMLLPVRFGVQQVCIERPLAGGCVDYESVLEPGSSVCPEYPVLCERDYIRPSEVLHYQTSALCDDT